MAAYQDSKLLTAKQMILAPSQTSLSVDKCVEELSKIIAEKIQVKKKKEEESANALKREKFLMETKANEEKARLSLLQAEDERQRTKSAMAASVANRTAKNSMVTKLFKSAKAFAATFKDFDTMEKAELRSHFRAYTADMDKSEVARIMAHNVAPNLVTRFCESAVAQCMFTRAKEVAVRRAEQRKLDEYLKKKRQKEAKVKRMTMYQQERTDHITKMESSHTVEEACRKDVSVALLRTLVERGIEKHKEGKHVEVFDQVCR